MRADKSIPARKFCAFAYHTHAPVPKRSIKNEPHPSLRTDFILRRKASSRSDFIRPYVTDFIFHRQTSSHSDFILSQSRRMDCKKQNLLPS